MAYWLVVEKVDCWVAWKDKERAARLVANWGKMKGCLKVEHLAVMMVAYSAVLRVYRMADMTVALVAAVMDIGSVGWMAAWKVLLKAQNCKNNTNKEINS